MNDNTALVTTLALIILAGFIFSGKPDITDGIIYQLTGELHDRPNTTIPCGCNIDDNTTILR